MFRGLTLLQYQEHLLWYSAYLLQSIKENYSMRTGRPRLTILTRILGTFDLNIYAFIKML